MIVWLFKLFTSILGIMVISLAIHNILFNYEENKCAMTWMYEYPEYIKVPLDADVQKKFPKYSLYIYGEGNYADYLQKMNGHYKLEGIPVVFVHGNAGRYKQVRSPGSVSLSKSERRKFHFNYFTVDYEEELSALYGPYLEQQTEFLNHCLQRIFKCYKHQKQKEQPKSVIAIGHSMGGIIIRGLLANPNFDAKQFNVIINLATPQTQPIISLDPFIQSYYRRINSVWLREASGKFKNITLLSLAGGYRDYLVRSDLCMLGELSTNPNHLSAITTELPNIWLENDHQCIVWCNQLVRAITRVFFNMINEKTGQIYRNPFRRFSILSQTLFHVYQQKGKAVDENILKICKDMLNLEFVTKITRDSSCYLLPTINDMENVYIWTSSTRRDWLLKCTSTNKCVKLEESRLLPGHNSYSQFQKIKGPFESGKFVLRTKKDENYLVMKKQIEAVFNIDLPYLHKHAEIELTPNTGFYTSFTLTGLVVPWQTYNITLNFTADNNKNPVIVILRAIWSKESRILIFNHTDIVRIPLKIFIENTGERFLQGNSVVEIEVLRENLSSFTIDVRLSFLDCLGQILRFHLDQLLRYTLISYVILESTNASKTWTGLFFCAYILVRLVSHMALSSGHFTKILYGILKVILPETFLIALALNQAFLLQFVTRLVFWAFSFLLFLPRKAIDLAVNVSCYKYLMLAFYLFVLPVIFLNTFFGITVILVTLVLIHGLQTTFQPCSNETGALKSTILKKVFHRQLPIISVFTIVPVITQVQDVLKGYKYQPVSYASLNSLAICYYVFLVLVNLLFLDNRANEKVFVEYFSEGQSSSSSIQNIFLILFMFNDFIALYNLTYILVVYFIIDIVKLCLVKMFVHKKLD